MNIFKKRWLKKQYDSAGDRKAGVVDLKQPKSLMIVSEIDVIPTYDECCLWAELLNVEAQNLDILCYSENPDQQKDSKIMYFDRKPFKWRGGLKDRKLQEALSHHHGLQINYFTKTHECLKFVASCSSADLKAGLPAKGAVHNDLTIDVPTENKEEFMDELLRYMEILTEKA